MKIILRLSSFQDNDLPILSIVNTSIDESNSTLRIGMRFIILIAGLIAFVGR